MSPSRRREPRKTVLSDVEHAARVADLVGQRTWWVTHDDERVRIEDMAPPHALSAFRKLIGYAEDGDLDYELVDIVASNLGVALRMQAMGEVAVQAELANFGRRAKPIVVHGLKVSTVLAAVEDIEEEISAGDDSGKYTGSVDYAARLTALINERLR